MLKMTLTLAAALYAGFVIWGQPSDVAAEAPEVSEPVVLASGADFDRPVIIGAEAPQAEAVVTRASVAERVLPDAATIAASAPSPAATQPRLIGEPVVVSLVQPSTPAPAAERQVEAEGLLKVTGSRVNMRSGPSTSNRVVDALVLGTLAEPLGEEVNGWIEIRDVVTGNTGFMASRFLEPS